MGDGHTKRHNANSEKIFLEILLQLMDATFGMNFFDNIFLMFQFLNTETTHNVYQAIIIQLSLNIL